MPDRDTLALIVLVVLGLVALVTIVERLSARSRPSDPVELRRWHAAAARKSLNAALVCVGLLVVALLLGRVLLGAMSVAGLVLFTGLALARARLSR